MEIKWKNYRIWREDEHNIQVERFEEAIANRTTKHISEGDAYLKKIHIGYFSTLRTALQAILDDCIVSEDINSLQAVLDRLNEAKQDLINIFHLISSHE